VSKPTGKVTIFETLESAWTHPAHPIRKPMNGTWLERTNEIKTDRKVE